MQAFQRKGAGGIWINIVYDINSGYGSINPLKMNTEFHNPTWHHDYIVNNSNGIQALHRSVYLANVSDIYEASQYGLLMPVYYHETKVRTLCKEIIQHVNTKCCGNSTLSYLAQLVSCRK